MKDILLKYRDLIYIIIIILIISLLTKKCGESNLDRQNQKALTDTLEVLKNKNNEKEYRISLFETNSKNLENLNNELYLELKKIKKGNVEYITKINTVYIDTNKIKVLNTYINLLNNKHQLNWSFVDDNSEFYGYTKFKVNFLSDNINKYIIIPDSTFLTKRLIKLSFTTGIIKEKDGTRRIFVTPLNKNVEVLDIKGAILEEKYYTRKKPILSVGVQVGYGLSFGNQVQMSPYIGLGIQYNLITLFNKKQTF